MKILDEWLMNFFNKKPGMKVGMDEFFFGWNMVERLLKDSWMKKFGWKNE